MGWLIALGVLGGIASIRLGVSVHYDSGGFLVRVIAGFFRFTLYPLPKRWKKGSPKDTSDQTSKSDAASAEPKPVKAEETKTGGSIKDFLPLVRIGLDFMNQFRKKLRINHLQLKLILAGDDPCDLAIYYGQAWLALGNLLPRLERVFSIGKRDCEVECDFTAHETRLVAHLDMTMAVMQLLTLGAVYGVRMLKELLILKKKRKGGAVT